MELRKIINSKKKMQMVGTAIYLAHAAGLQCLGIDASDELRIQRRPADNRRLLDRNVAITISSIWLRNGRNFRRSDSMNRLDLSAGKIYEYGRYFLQVTFQRSQLQVTRYLPQNSIKTVYTVLMERG